MVFKVLGIVETTSPHCSLYRIVVFPAPAEFTRDLRIMILEITIQSKNKNPDFSFPPQLIKKRGEQISHGNLVFLQTQHVMGASSLVC
jgi:hypothetical protein